MKASSESGFMLLWRLKRFSFGALAFVDLTLVAYDIVLSVSALLISLFTVTMLERIIWFKVKTYENPYFYSAPKAKYTMLLQLSILCIHKDKISEVDSEGSQTKYICGTIWENSSSVVCSNHKVM